MDNLLEIVPEQQIIINITHADSPPRSVEKMLHHNVLGCMPCLV